MERKFKILNLYAGLGGNRKLWDLLAFELGIDLEITAIEYTNEIANVYRKLYPQDRVLVEDAHEYLLQNYEQFDFIWSSPPCQSHSKMMKATRHTIRKYPDMKLYEEIIFLNNFFKGGFIVENVKPYYKPLVEGYKQVGRHLFWNNFNLKNIKDEKRPKDFINKSNLQGRQQLQLWLNIFFEEKLYYQGNHCPCQVLRNCVHPNIGKQILRFFLEKIYLNRKN